MTALKRTIGIYILACLFSVYACGEQYLSPEPIAYPIKSEISSQTGCQDYVQNDFSSPVFFWHDCRFFQEWRELVKKIASVERRGGTITAKFSQDIWTRQELNYQHAFLEQGTGNAASPDPVTSPFQITRHTLQKLRDAGIPDELLHQLEQMKGRQFVGQDQLWEAVKLGVDQTTLMEYQTAILMYAAADENMPMTRTQPIFESAFSEHLTPTSFENTAAWETLFYYPEAIKKALSSSRKKLVTRKVSYDQDTWFNIRALLKRWGVPKPLTLILIGLGLYLLFALFSRR